MVGQLPEYVWEIHRTGKTAREAWKYQWFVFRADDDVRNESNAVRHGSSDTQFMGRRYAKKAIRRLRESDRLRAAAAVEKVVARSAPPPPPRNPDAVPPGFAREPDAIDRHALEAEIRAARQRLIATQQELVGLGAEELVPASPATVEETTVDGPACVTCGFVPRLPVGATAEATIHWDDEYGARHNFQGLRLAEQNTRPSPGCRVPVEKCEVCDGSGRVNHRFEVHKSNPMMDHWESNECRTCGGSGMKP